MDNKTKIEYPKVGDKMKIISPDGHSSTTDIIINGKRFDYAHDIEIHINPASLITADLKTCFNELDIEAEIASVINFDPRIDQIKKIFKQMDEGNFESGDMVVVDEDLKNSLALNRIKNIIKQQ